ncbi:MAG TPA: hypothetical protein VFQ06_08490, partial [Nitrospira sp.]|nr:hypothetical protein [Nitrospira sp.]
MTSTARACALQANTKAGVLVVVGLVEFRDGSGRSNFFDREFYYRSAVAYPPLWYPDHRAVAAPP